MISVNLSTEKIDLLKRTICKGATDDELELFLHQCKRCGLDPFSNQIYSIKRGNSRTIQTGIDGFRLVADRTGNYSPGKETVFTYDKENNIISATAYVNKRNNDGTWHEVSSTAYMDEFKPKYESNFWKNMPRVMLAKCAEAQALRKAFPSDLSGIYTKEEMDQADKKELEMKGEISLTELKKESDLEERSKIDFENKQKIDEERIKSISSQLCEKLGVPDSGSLLRYIRIPKIMDSFLSKEDPVSEMDAKKCDTFLSFYQKWLEKNPPEF